MHDYRLEDLGIMVQDTRKRVAEEYNFEDVCLSDSFKDAVSKWEDSCGNLITYSKTGVMITTAANLKIYAPNQWFILAAYAVKLLKELMRYREYTEKIIDDYLPSFIDVDASLTDKKDVYKALKAGDNPRLENEFQLASVKTVKAMCGDDKIAEDNTALIYRFVSDDKWWLGGKGIDRSNDFYVSPVLGVLDLVNASQSYVASITYAYATEQYLSDALPNILADDGFDSNDLNYIFKNSSQGHAISAKEQKERFSNWHEKQLKSDGDPYSPDTVKTRISAMETGFSRFKENKDYDSVFQIQNAKELSDYINALANDQKFVDYDKRTTNHCSEGLNKYQIFLDENECGSGELCFATSFVNSMPRNQIIFGAPGTGKSYTLNKKREELLGRENETDYERVTFHPDYSYANFVGTYKPVPCKDSDDKDAITYEYVPGPFMRVYVNALKNGRTGNPKPFLLIIEEINRADVAAVFGDMFQLLDRGDDEVSEYPIQASEDIKNYLTKELGGEPDDYSKILLPNNMFIWATMNSADQGVFPMDTAFKRRWDFTYLGIDDSEKGLIGKKVDLGKDGYRHRVEWNNLRKAINRFLAEKGINEDKQLGPYFIARKIVVPKDGEDIKSDEFIATFKNKVLMYLFEDAAKQKRSSLFAEGSSRYSEICKDFDEKGVYVFCNDIVNWAEIKKINESDSPVLQ